MWSFNSWHSSRVPYSRFFDSLGSGTHTSCVGATLKSSHFLLIKPPRDTWLDSPLILLGPFGNFHRLSHFSSWLNSLALGVRIQKFFVGWKIWRETGCCQTQTGCALNILNFGKEKEMGRNFRWPIWASWESLSQSVSNRLPFSWIRSSTLELT